MTTEIEKLMMGYSWNVEKSIFFNFHYWQSFGIFNKLQ